MWYSHYIGRQRAASANCGIEFVLYTTRTVYNLRAPVSYRIAFVAGYVSRHGYLTLQRLFTMYHLRFEESQGYPFLVLIQYFQILCVITSHHHQPIVFMFCNFEHTPSLEFNV
jgi:hypothetical protein